MILRLTPTLILAASCLGVTPQPQISHANWALEHADSCRRTIFGDLENYRRDGAEGIVVVLRYFDTFGVETQVVLDRRPGMSAGMRVTMLGENPLIDQLSSIHRGAPTSSSEDACMRVQRESFLRSGPRIDAILEELHAISMSPVLSAPFVIHGSSYEVWIFAAATEIHFSFLGPASPDSAPHPLQIWCDGLLAFAMHSRAETPELRP